MLPVSVPILGHCPVLLAMASLDTKEQAFSIHYLRSLAFQLGCPHCTLSTDELRQQMVILDKQNCSLHFSGRGSPRPVLSPQVNSLGLLKGVRTNVWHPQKIQSTPLGLESQRHDGNVMVKLRPGDSIGVFCLNLNSIPRIHGFSLFKARCVGTHL